MELTYQLGLEIKDLNRSNELLKRQLAKLKQSIGEKAPYGEPPSLLEKQISEAYISINEVNRTLMNIKDLAEQIERRAAQ